MYYKYTELTSVLNVQEAKFAEQKISHQKEVERVTNLRTDHRRKLDTAKNTIGSLEEKLKTLESMSTTTTTTTIITTQITKIKVLIVEQEKVVTGETE